jgi:hypothetical protein
MGLFQRSISNPSLIEGTGDVMQVTGNTPISHALILNSSLMFGMDEIFTTWQDATNVSFYQSAVGWSLNDMGHPKGEHGFGTLIYGESAPVDWTRSVCGMVLGRCPRMLSSGSMLNSVSTSYRDRGFETGGWNVQINIEENVFIEAPFGIANSSIVITSNTDPASRIFYTNGGNRGMGGLADPPSVNNDGVAAILSASRNATFYPTGYTLHDAGNSTATETAFVQLVVSCNGPRPNDRIPLVQDFYDEVLSLGTTATLIDNPSEVGGLPVLAQNSTTHADIPADPNAAGTHINAAMDWLIGKSDALLPAGAGCN